MCYYMLMVILTAKQTLWAEYYIQHRNGTKAARLAGYKGDDNAHAVVASRNLRNAKIRAYLSERYAAVAMCSDEVLMRLANIARASLGDFCDDLGVIDWPKVAAAGYPIKSFKRGDKIEFESKLRALELIGKAHGLYITKIAPTDPTGEKEYGADARNDLLGKLLPELTGAGAGGEAEETID